MSSDKRFTNIPARGTTLLVFTTGDNAAGYDLTGVVSHLTDVGANAVPRVSIYSAVKNNSGAVVPAGDETRLQDYLPGSSLYTLATPGLGHGRRKHLHGAPRRDAGEQYVLCHRLGELRTRDGRGLSIQFAHRWWERSISADTPR